MQNLTSSLEGSGHSIAFQNYLHVRDRVLAMLEESARHRAMPSNYWQEELAGFSYMLDASPLIIDRLREHCYHITGLRSYDYRQHHAHQRDAFVRKLNLLCRTDKTGLFVPEPPVLGGFGHAINGGLVNTDTLKFYEALIALDKADLLEQFRESAHRRRVVLEIGAGWGGFAYQFKTLHPNTCYVIIDLPQTLLFSAVYLMTLFPEAKILIYGDKPGVNLLENASDYDFVFLPSFLGESLSLPYLDLVINMVSFQEMKTAQVEGYVQRIYQLNCPNIYSLNRDRSANNGELTAVSSIIGKFYRLSEIDVVDIPYGIMPPPEASTWTGHLFSECRRLLPRFHRKSAHDYRHLVGSLAATSM